VINSVYDAAMAAIKTLEDVNHQVTAYGRKNQGNQTIRLHYKRDNLLTKFTVRHDLSKLGSMSQEVLGYVAHLEQADLQAPWLRLPGKEMFKLTAMPKLVRIDVENTLPSGVLLSDRLFGALGELPYTKAFVRQWTAKGKGVGLEAVFLFEKDGEFAVAEMSLNFYTQTTMEKFLAAMQPLHPHVTVQ